MRSLAAERELADMFTPRAARAKAVCVSGYGEGGKGGREEGGRMGSTEGGEELAGAGLPFGD